MAANESNSPLRITADLPGVGGRIKVRPEDFAVREIPVYLPSGQGDHLFLRLTRQGLTTRQVVDDLARLLRVKGSEIGTAGQKDKQAVTTQTFSINLSTAEMTRDPDEIVRLVGENLPVVIESADRHANKLKTGHLLGNRFTILVRDAVDQALPRAEAIKRVLLEKGLPNFYGRQRFGAAGRNVDRGRRTLDRGAGKKNWLDKFTLNALQSSMFNDYLAQRMNRDWFGRVLAGDVVKKTDTGGVFIVEDESTDQARFEAGEIIFTGPIYGKKMRWAQGEPGELEKAVLEESGVGLDQLAKARLMGSRRPGIVRLDDIGIEATDEGLVFTFNLPKGGYATVLLDEFMKTEIED